MARKEKLITFEKAAIMFFNPNYYEKKIDFGNQTVITQKQLEKICEEYNNQIINTNNQKNKGKEKNNK